MQIRRSANRPPGRRSLGITACIGVLAATLPLAAAASNLVDRNATHVSLQVNQEKVALLSYTANGRIKRRVVAWGAVNAIAPDPNRRQVEFKLRYVGPQGPIRTEVAQGGFTNSCRRYSGPEIPWFVAGCTAPDGSFWALQSWQRPQPNYGVPARSRALLAWELRISHWKGALPVLTVKQDWSYKGRFQHFYGSYSYRRRPVYGFTTTSKGAPLDRFGVLIYLDTFNSSYGKGWKRENSYVAHKPTGIWCYSLNPHGLRPAGAGRAYRITAQSPGGLPDVTWTGNTLGSFDAELDQKANAEQAQSFSDRLCRPN